MKTCAKTIYSTKDMRKFAARIPDVSAIGWALDQAADQIDHLIAGLQLIADTCSGQASEIAKKTIEGAKKC